MSLWNESTSLLDAAAAAAGWFAWNAVWQGTLVVGAAWLFCRLFRSAPGRVHVWAWRTAAVKFMLLAILPASAAIPLALPAETFPWLESFREFATFASPPAADSSAPAATPEKPAAVSATDAGVASTPFQLPPWLGRTLFLAACLLVAGRLLRLATEVAEVRRLLRTAAPIDDPAMLKRLETESRRIGLESTPRLLQVPGAGSPFAAGWLRPAVVIPTKTLHRLAAEELRLVCGHEAAHLKHGDALWRLLAAAVRAVYFFHPAVGLLERELRHAEELAADEAALRRQRWSPAEYVGTLVSILDRCGARRERFATLAEAAGSASGLTRRLEFMKDRMTQEVHGSLWSGRLRRGACALAAAAVCLTAVPWRLAAEEPKPVPPVKPVPAAKAESVRLATIVLTEKKKNGPKLTLAAPKIVFSGKGPATMEMGDASRRIEISVHADESADPTLNVVKLKVVRDPKTPSEVVLLAPTITLLDEQEGVFLAADAESLEMKVHIRVVDPKEIEAAPAAK